MKQEDILKYLLIAAGAYLVYEYVIKPMMASTTPAVAPASNTGTLPAGPTNTAPTTTATPPVTTPTAPGPTTEQQIMSLSGATSNASTLTMDQWGYYYNQIKPAIPPATFERMLGNVFGAAYTNGDAGVQAAMRGTPVTLAQFMGALNGAGLSGIVPAFSQLPPSMTFGKGFSSGFGMKRGSRSTAGSGMVN